ncbi:hypothetical protein [Thermoleptolyngbya sp.]
MGAIALRIAGAARATRWPTLWFCRARRALTTHGSAGGPLATDSAAAGDGLCSAQPDSGGHSSFGSTTTDSGDRSLGLPGARRATRWQ